MSSSKLERKVSELGALYEVAKTLGSSLDLTETSQKAFAILHKMLGLNRGTLVLKDFQTGEYGIWAAHGLTRKEIERGRYKVGEGVTGKVLETGKPMVVPDIGKEPLFLNRTKARDLKKFGVSFLCVPVMVKAETIGVLSADRIFGDEEHAYEDDIRFLTVLASLIGQAAKVSATVQEKQRELKDENIHLHEELRVKYRLANVVGGSRKMQEVYETVEKVAPTKSTVLIRGESGTGKELIARALHYNSPRAGRPFIRVSCAALPETLLESELFGHERGAFTGAQDMRKGRFELADGGTLFLDEIGEMNQSTQVKLLRVLQERKFERLGGTSTLSVDVRLVAATNRDLEKAIEEGKFREDLYYRLNVIPVYLPPLREREGDILLLIEHFLQLANRDHNKRVVFSRPALDRLSKYAWPGNVRELENCLERAVVLAPKDQIELEDLPLAIRAGVTVAPEPATAQPGHKEEEGLPGEIRNLEKDKILKTLQSVGGVQVRAAKALGLTQRQLGYKLKKYGIRLRVPVLE